MTIRAKLFAAIALTVLGPLVTIGVALVGVRHARRPLRRRGAGERAAGGRARPEVRGHRHERLADRLRLRRRPVPRPLRGLGRGRPRRCSRGRAARSPRRPSVRCSTTLEREFAAFMALDEDAWSALQDDRPEETKRILLGPELEHFEAMAAAADELAAVQDRHVAEARTGFDDASDTRAARAGGGRDRRRHRDRAPADHGAGRRPTRAGAAGRTGLTRDVILTVGLLLGAGLDRAGAGRRHPRARRSCC